MLNVLINIRPVLVAQTAGQMFHRVLGNMSYLKSLVRDELRLSAGRAFPMVLVALAMLAVGCSNGLGGESTEPTERIEFVRASWLSNPKPTNLNNVRFAMQDSALHQLKFRMTPTEVEKALGPPSETYSGDETLPESTRTGATIGVNDRYTNQSRDFFYLIGKDSNSSNWSYYLVVRFHDNQLYYAYIGLN